MHAPTADVAVGGDDANVGRFSATTRSLSLPGKAAKACATLATHALCARGPLGVGLYLRQIRAAGWLAAGDDALGDGVDGGVEFHVALKVSN